MIAPDTLRQFCGPTKMTGRVMRIDAHGKSWAFATQNQGFLMVPADGHELSEPDPAIARSVPTWAESALTAEFTLPFAALKSFVDNGVPLESLCPDCSDGTAECPHCEQTMPCDSCGGSRSVPRDRDEVLMFDVPFDATLVAHFLRYLDAETVRIVRPGADEALFIADAEGSWVVGIPGVRLMSRLRTDQACLDAQLRQQVQCQLTAELAQPRDTIPCPAPTESLERASARAFAKNMRDDSLPGDVRFWRRVAVGDPGSCWEWQGCRGLKGYGKLRQGRSSTRAHRVAWKQAFGEIPDGMWVLHKCDNPPCCNPAHLFLGDNSDNVRDKVMKGRQACGLSVRAKPRPCSCGQTIWSPNPSRRINGEPVCADCFGNRFASTGPVAPLDRRIAEAREPDAVQCAWSTPSSEGESW